MKFTIYLKLLLVISLITFSFENQTKYNVETFKIQKFRDSQKTLLKNKVNSLNKWFWPFVSADKLEERGSGNFDSGYISSNGLWIISDGKSTPEFIGACSFNPKVYKNPITNFEKNGIVFNFIDKSQISQVVQKVKGVLEPTGVSNQYYLNCKNFEDTIFSRDREGLPLISITAYKDVATNNFFDLVFVFPITWNDTTKKVQVQEDESVYLTVVDIIQNHCGTKFQKIINAKNDIKDKFYNSIELKNSIKSNSDDLKSKQEQVELLKNQIKTLEAKINSSKNTLTTLKSTFDDTSKEIETKQVNLESQNLVLTQAKKELASNEDQKSQFSQNLNSLTFELNSYETNYKNEISDIKNKIDQEVDKFASESKSRFQSCFEQILNGDSNGSFECLKTIVVK